MCLVEDQYCVTPIDDCANNSYALANFNNCTVHFTLQYDYKLHVINITDLHFYCCKLITYCSIPIIFIETIKIGDGVSNFFILFFVIVKS